MINRYPNIPISRYLNIIMLFLRDTMSRYNDITYNVLLYIIYNILY